MVNFKLINKSAVAKEIGINGKVLQRKIAGTYGHKVTRADKLLIAELFEKFVNQLREE